MNHEKKETVLKDQDGKISSRPAELRLKAFHLF